MQRLADQLAQTGSGAGTGEGLEEEQGRGHIGAGQCPQGSLSWKVGPHGTMAREW